MGNIANLLAKLANSLDRIGLRREANQVDGMLKRAIRLFQTPKKEEFFGHVIDPAPGNLVYISGPLLIAKGIHTLLLGEKKREIERRHKAFEELLSKLPQGYNVEYSPNGGPIEILLPGYYDLTIELSHGKVVATAFYNSKAKALARKINNRETEPGLLRAIGREIPTITEEKSPDVTLIEQPSDRPTCPSDTQVRNWAYQLAQGEPVSIPCDKFLCDENDFDTQKDSDLKKRFRKYLSQIWEFRQNFAVEDRFENNRIELRRFDRESDISLSYEVEKGRMAEEWLRVPDTAVRTDQQLAQRTNTERPDLKTYLEQFKTRTNEAAFTQVVDDHYTVGHTWENRFAIVVKGIPSYIYHKDANSDNDWWSGRKIPEKTKQGSKVDKERLEAFMVPAKGSITKVFVGPAFKEQGKALESVYEVHYNLEDYDLGRKTQALRLLNELNIDWSNKPAHDDEPLTEFRMLSPWKPGVGYGSQMFVTPEIAEWVKRNHGVFLDKELWDKASALLVGFPDVPAVYPAKAEGFKGVFAKSVELPKVDLKLAPPEFLNRPRGKEYESCQPAALKARVIRESKQPFAFLEVKGKVYIRTTEKGFEFFRSLLLSPMCGKQPSRKNRIPALSRRSPLKT